jgi:hypothetical protein
MGRQLQVATPRQPRSCTGALPRAPQPLTLVDMTDSTVLLAALLLGALLGAESSLAITPATSARSL